MRALRRSAGIVLLFALAGCGHAQPPVHAGEDVIGGHGQLQVRTGKEVIDGPLPVEHLRDVVRRHLDRIRACYPRSDASSQGSNRLSIRFDVAMDGTVGSAWVAQSTMDTPDVGACVVDAVNSWQFHQLDAGATAEIPFVTDWNGE